MKVTYPKCTPNFSQLFAVNESCRCHVAFARRQQMWNIKGCEQISCMHQIPRKTARCTASTLPPVRGAVKCERTSGYLNLRLCSCMIYIYIIYIYIYIIYICIYPSCFLMTCFSRFPERPGVSIHVEVHRATQVRGVEGLNLTWPVADFQITTVRSSRICKTCILREKRWTTDKNCRLWDFWVWDFWAAWRDVAQVPDIPTTQITRLSCGVNLQGEQVCRCDAGWYGPECNQLLASQHRKECFYGPHPSSSP